MTIRLEYPKFQAFDSNGDPLSGGLVYTYEAGTSTLKTTYSDYDASTANANPVVLNSRGEADIYAKGTYKIVLKDSDGTTIWTLDNVQGGVGSDAIGDNYYYPDSDATDQGVTGSSNTIKYAVDTIGADSGTIYLKHAGDAATTTYTLTTSEYVPANVDIKFENGAFLDGAGTLTLDNAGQIIAPMDYEIFDSDFSVVLTNGGTVSPKWFGATGDGTTDDGEAFNTAIFTASPSIVKIPVGIYEISTKISEGGSYPIIENMIIENLDSGLDSYFLQDSDVIFDMSSSDYTSAKNSMLEFKRLVSVGDGSTASVLWDIGGIDFAIWDNCIFREASSNCLDFGANLVSAIRFKNCWFFDNETYGIKFDSTRVFDVDIVGCRFEGSSDYRTKNHCAIYISNSPRNHTTSLDANQMATVRIMRCEFERLSRNGILVDTTVGGVQIKDNQIGYGNVFLSHTASFCEVSGNILFDESPSIIDSGYGNRIFNNIVPNMDYSSVPVFEDRGYNSMIEKADNYNSQGDEGWTFGAGTSRQKGFGPGSGRFANINPMLIASNGSVTRTGVTASASTFYVLRIAWSIVPTTSKKSQGLEVVITDQAATGLLDTGSLVDDDSAIGHVSYDSFVFKTDAATTSLSISINGLNSESTYVYLFDIAENKIADNPNFEDTWVGGLPTANWVVTGDWTHTEYTADTHSGSSCLRLQATNPFTQISNCYVDYGAVFSDGDAFEVSFWIKNLRPTATSVSIRAGQGYLGDQTVGPGKLWQWTPMWGDGKWEKVTFQCVHNDSDPNFLYIASIVTGTYQDSIDVLIDDLAVVPISSKLNKLKGSVTWNPGSIADGDEEATTISIPGAYLGDFAIASFSLDVSDLTLDAQVTADGVVTCVLANNTGGAVNLDSGTLYAIVFSKNY